MIATFSQPSDLITYYPDCSDIPSPSALKASVLVSGHTSTLKHIHVACVGQAIPATYSGDTMTNTQGYQWYVSEHYALKTDFTAEEAIEHLITLELAFPHYVETFGVLLPDLDVRRMACVYGKHRHSLLRAMVDDDQHGGFGYGGICQEGYNTAYQSPSNPWHSRYILLHECVHLYQFCLGEAGWSKPGHWFVEGVAQSLSEHTYDPRLKQLTVYVEANGAGMPTKPIVQEYKDIKRNFKGMCGTPGGSYPSWADTAQFLRQDPESYVKFQILQYEARRQWDGHSDQIPLAMDLTQKIYGSWASMNKKHQKWLNQPRHVYRRVRGLFDQFGDTYETYDATGRFKHESIMGVDVTPGDTPDPVFLMDYPPTSKPNRIGSVARGVDEPAVAVDLDLSHAPNAGKAGLLLARSKTSHISIVIEKGAWLVIEGLSTGGTGSKGNTKGARRRRALPEDFIKSMAHAKFCVGLRVVVSKSSLYIEVTTGDKKVNVFSCQVSLTAAQRKRIMQQPMGLISQGGKHLMTPYMDDGRVENDLHTQEAAPNRWRNPSMTLWVQFARADFILGRSSPALLRQWIQRCEDESNASTKAQHAIVRNAKRDLPDILKSIAGVKVSLAKKQAALNALFGAQFSLTVDKAKSNNRKVTVSTNLYSPVFGPIKASVGYEGRQADGSRLHIPKGELKTSAGRIKRTKHTLTLDNPNQTFYVKAKGKIVLHGVTIHLSAQVVGNEGLSQFHVIGPFAGVGHSKDVSHGVAKTPIDDKPIDIHACYHGQANNVIQWQSHERPEATPVDRMHLLHLPKIFKSQANESVAYAVTWVNAPKAMDVVLSLGSNDGVAAWCNDELVHESYDARDWRHRQDRMRIRLKAGRNELRFKLMHYGALWFFSAALEDQSGLPVTGLTMDKAPEAQASFQYL